MERMNRLTADGTDESPAPTQLLLASKTWVAHCARNIGDANPPAQPFRRTAEYLCNSSCGLFVLLYESPVRVHFKQGLFTARFDERLVIPLTIGIVFPYNLNDLSACRLFVNCLLDRFGERL